MLLALFLSPASSRMTVLSRLSYRSLASRHTAHTYYCAQSSNLTNQKARIRPPITTHSLLCYHALLVFPSLRLVYHMSRHPYADCPWAPHITASPFSQVQYQWLGVGFVQCRLSASLPPLSFSLFLSLSPSLPLSFPRSFSLLTKASHVQASEGKVFVGLWNFHVFSCFALVRL